jgi:ectoine hydroxylase-related dioxygenase (phytanoyl-CoA dioxygenase family)
LGQIRRLERFYNKTHYLNLLNKKNEKILELIFGEKFNIFKDKFNLKPPGGEGFNAHYDGIFYFKINKRNYPGWYTYASSFINILIPFDNSNKKNGTIKIAKEDKKKFAELLKNTKKNGTPELKTAYEKRLKFRYLNLSVGDICIFSNRCAHKSDSNKTKYNRRILYYTYNKKSEGNFYKKYFFDKKKSQSKFKSLSGNL